MNYHQLWILKKLLKPSDFEALAIAKEHLERLESLGQRGSTSWDKWMHKYEALKGRVVLDGGTMEDDDDKREIHDPCDQTP